MLVSDEPFISTNLNVVLDQRGVTSTLHAGSAGAQISFPINRSGRYIRVQLLGTEYLSLAEVEVFTKKDIDTDGDGIVDRLDNNGSTNNNAPVLTNPGNQNSAEGDSINLTVTATDEDGDSLHYSATNLPDGLVIDSDNGTISGVTNAAGNFNVTVTVSDGNGGLDSGDFSWEVQDPSLVLTAICEAGVDPQVIRRGEGTALWWWSDAVTTGSIDQGIGSVNIPSDYNWLFPTETTTYTMTAQGSDGTATTCKATVVVEGQIEQNPPVCQLGADPQSIMLGEGSAL